MRELASVLIRVLTEHDYGEQELPLWFSWDDLRQLLANSSGPSTLKLIDGQGSVMALRSDFTAAVALGLGKESVSSRRKLSYAGPVYRAEQGECIALEQVGCESIGSGSLEDDLELIRVSVECFRRVGLDQVAVVVNSVALLRQVTAQFGAKAQKELLALAKRRSVAGLKTALLELGQPGQDLALYLFSADCLDSLARFTDCSVELERLQAAYKLLQKLGISVCFDPTLVREPDYYTGLVFEFYAQGVPHALGGGGRYDRLIRGQSGFLPAAGFALNINALKAARTKAITSQAYELSGHH